MRRIFGILLVAVCGLSSPMVWGQSIVSYDIEDAAVSGFGLWEHEYDGLITVTGSGTAESPITGPVKFELADYSGGSGTLNDVFFGTGVNDTQLFANNDQASPIITVHLDGFYTINNVILFSFDGTNVIPGNIGSVDVTIDDLTANIVTTTGQLNQEFLDVSASALDGVATNHLTFSNFSPDDLTDFTEFFSISEIVVDGVAIPEPTASVVLVLGTISLVSRRRTSLSCA